MKKLPAITLILVALFALQSCHGLRTQVRTSRVTITVGGKPAASVKAGPAITKTSPLSTALPTDVYTIQVIVSAEDMMPIMTSVPVAGLPNVTITIEVPNGVNRNFVVEGLDAGDIPLYIGQATADLTGAPVSLAVSLSHLTPPAILSTSPASDAVNVAINAVISATFNWPMDTATITASSFLVTDGGGNPVSGTVLASGSTATFTPAANLSYGTSYTAAITTAVNDLVGLSLASDYTWTFTTSPDSTPPTFNGIALVSSPSLTSQQLSWSAASDNVTPPSGIVYLIYQATSPGGENFATPTFTTAPGATSYLVTVAPGVTYYYVVRAQDAAGNNDGNSNELSGYYAGTYVNVATGLDLTGCGAPTSPCQTITYALSQPTTTILVAPGIYSSSSVTGNSETFPLQLKPGTDLICYGANHSSILDSSSDGVYGNVGASIQYCTVRVCDSTGISDTIGGGGPTPLLINNVYLDGISCSGGAGDAIVLGADSTVIDTVIEDPFTSGITINSGNPIIQSTSIVVTGTQSVYPYYGIYVAAGSPTITNSTISGFFADGVGWAVDLGTGNGIVSLCTRSGNGGGVGITGGSPSVSGNTISNSSSNGGIRISGGTPAITANKINNGTYGIYLEGSVAAPAATISGNIIDNNNYGIYATAVGSSSIRNNSLSCNTLTDFYLADAGASGFDVSNNAWDHDATTLVKGPTISSDTTGYGGDCPPGVDICYNYLISTPPSYSPFNAAVSGGCSN